MSKNKKGKVINKNKNIVMTSYVDDKSTKWYQKKWPQRLIALGIGIILAVPVWVLVGYFADKMYGYDDQRTMIETTMLAVKNADKTKISRSFENRNETVKANVTAYASSIHDQMTIDLDSTYTSYEDTEVDASFLSDQLKQTPDEAMSTIATIDTKRKTSSGSEYECLTLYEIMSYRLNDRWYISAFAEIGSEVVHMDQGVDGYNAMGMDGIGWMNIGNTSWKSYAVENTLFDNTDTMCFEYTGNDHTSTIISSILYDTVSIKDAESKITDSMENDDTYFGVTASDTTLGGIKCRKVMGITLSDAGTPVVSYTWLFKNALIDPYVHQLTLETTDSEKTYPIAMSYYL